MKKFVGLLCAVVLVFGVAGMASATTLVDQAELGDVDAWGGSDMTELEFFGDFLTWTHHFEFVPPAQEVLSGELTIGLLSPDDSNEALFGFPPVDAMIIGLNWEIGGGLAEDGSWDLGEIDTGDYKYEVDVAYLTDGEFTITIASLDPALLFPHNNFRVVSSELVIEYEPVPEPSTVLLLGVGLLGLIGFGRKKLKK